MAKLINTTPHTINMIISEGDSIAIPASGNTIRLSQKVNKIGEINGLPLTKVEYGTPEYITPEGTGSMPTQEDEVYFIVSAMVKAAMPDRTDLLVPAEQVRDADGKIIGCKSLSL